jgi:hypothetical protein
MENQGKLRDFTKKNSDLAYWNVWDPTLPCPIVLGTTAVSKMMGTRSGFRNQGFGTDYFRACSENATFKEMSACFIVWRRHIHIQNDHMIYCVSGIFYDAETKQN